MKTMHVDGQVEMLINKSVTLFNLIAKENPNIFFCAMIFGIISGVGYSLIFPLVLYSFAPQNLLVPHLALDINYTFFDSPKSTLAKLFLINCAIIFFAKSISSIGNNYLSHHMSVALRTSLYGKIGDAPIVGLDKVGYERLVSALNVDVIAVVTGATVIPIVLTSGATLIGLLIYVAYLNAKALYFVLMFLFLGVITFQLLVFLSEKYLKSSRETFDTVQEGIRGLVYGAKDLKVHEQKNSFHHLQVLGKNEKLALKDHLIGTSILLIATSYAELLVFIMIGIAAFHLSYVYFIDTNDLVGIVMGLLYITGPVGLFLNSIPQIIKGNIALKKIQDVSRELEGEKINRNILPFPTWNKITLKCIEYEYVGSRGDHFKVENINLELKKGELTFIVGGNGSGKSTLAKILSMHYLPQAGTMMLDDIVLGPENIKTARQFVGAVFTDFYLFNKLYGYEVEKKHIVDSYLKYLGLDHKVSINEKGEFSTISLSDGQKKRLALLSALLDDKDIYIFDEWASDQDPQFKKIFYEVILPDLKFRQKVIVAVTHDDAYFHLADKVIYMDYGLIRPL